MGETSSSLYRDVILHHSRNPRNNHPVEPADFRGRAHNPLCGDELELTVILQDSRVSQIGVQVRGCAIAEAAASMMSEVLIGHSLEESGALGELFQKFLKGESDVLPPELAPLQPLEAIRNNTSRRTCAILGWMALESGVRTPPADK